MPKPTKAYGIRTGQFKSKFEASIAENLTHRGVPFAYESERLSYVLPPKWYTPDFVLKIEVPCGSCSGKGHHQWAEGKSRCPTCSGRGHNPRYIESKGWFKSADRTKLLAVKKANPHLDIRLLFMRGKSKLSKDSDTTYAQWAEKNGFPWAEGVSIPKEWLTK